jgi:hypothetical protein
MRPTPEQLKEVEAHASNFLSPIEICLVMGFCLNDISYFDKQDNPLYLSYQKGRLKAKSGAAIPACCAFSAAVMGSFMSHIGGSMPNWCSNFSK